MKSKDALPIVLVIVLTGEALAEFIARSGTFRNILIVTLVGALLARKVWNSQKQ